MDLKNWKIDEDGAAISTIEKVAVTWTHFFMDVWIELEEGKKVWTEHQKLSLENFLSIHLLMKEQLAEKLKKVLKGEFTNQKVVHFEYDNISKTIN